MAKKVTLTFTPTGHVKVAAEGFTGGTCLDATRIFEDMFSKEVGEREMVGECAGRRDDGERVRY